MKTEVRLYKKSIHRLYIERITAFLIFPSFLKPKSQTGVEKYGLDYDPKKHYSKITEWKILWLSWCFEFRFKKK